MGDYERAIYDAAKCCDERERAAQAVLKTCEFVPGAVGDSLRLMNSVREREASKCAAAIRLLRPAPPAPVEPLPRCEHGHALRDHGDDFLWPPCGCRHAEDPTFTTAPNNVSRDGAERER